MLMRVLARRASQLPGGDIKPAPYTGLEYTKALQLRKKHMFSCYFHYYKEPLMIVEGKMQYLFDHKGRRYLDLIGGISSISVGHCHPRITKIIREQAEKLVHTSTIYLNEHSAEYCAAIAKKCPPGIDQVFLTNSGSEANDLAMLMARMYTQEYKFISLRNAYHGNVMGITNMHTWNHGLERGFAVQKAGYPGEYRSIYQGPNRGEFYVKEVAELAEATTHGKLAGFICEPVMGAGGIVPLPKGYLKGVYEVIRKYKGVCIADEVQTGFGRVGTKYWGCIDDEATPDIMTMAKSIGNGLPLGAVVARKEIADSIAKKLFFNTFSAGPIQSRVGHEVIKIIDEERLDKHCEQMGNYIMTGLKRIAEASRFIGDVRGKGFMMGIDIVKDKGTKEPDAATCGLLMEATREKGILFGKGGQYSNLLRLQPPMCLNKADADFLLSTFEEIVKAHK